MIALRAVMLGFTLPEFALQHLRLRAKIARLALSSLNLRLNPVHHARAPVPLALSSRGPVQPRQTVDARHVRLVNTRARLPGLVAVLVRVPVAPAMSLRETALRPAAPRARNALVGSTRENPVLRGAVNVPLASTRAPAGPSVFSAMPGNTPHRQVRATLRLA